MKPQLKLIVVGLGALALGMVAGYSYSSYSVNRAFEETVNALLLSNDALKTTEFTMLLKGIRDGKPDFVTERIESLLDFSLIDLARDYSPSRDSYGTAARALALARKYRTEHPRTASLGVVDQQVKSALSIKTDQTQNQ